MNSGKFAVTASDGSLAISSNKFTVAGNTGNTVVAGTLDAGGTTLSSLSSGAATLSSTLDVAGDVDVNSGKFAVTASDGSLAISSNKFTVAGNTGNTVVAGTLDVTGATYVEQPELGSCDAVEHAGCGRRRGREQWEVCGDGIGRVAGDFVEQDGGWRHGQHGGGGDA